MEKKKLITIGVVLLVIITIVAVPVIRSKQQYKELTADRNMTESQPSVELNVPSYKDTLLDSISNKPNEEQILDRVDVTDNTEPSQEVEPTQDAEEIQTTGLPQPPIEGVENVVASFEPVKFSSIADGKGIIIKSDEEVANASGYFIGDTVIDNAQYVLAFGSEYYNLIYSEKTWDGFLLQDITVGIAYDTLEDALANSGIAPKGVPVYLPLNIGGIKTVAEFNQKAAGIYLIIFDGTNYSKISYAELVQ